MFDGNTLDVPKNILLQLFGHCHVSKLHVSPHICGCFCFPKWPTQFFSNMFETNFLGLRTPKLICLEKLCLIFFSFFTCVLTDVVDCFLPQVSVLFRPPKAYDYSGPSWISY